MAVQSYVFTCRYCGQVYVREAAFLSHKCDRMLREELLHTVTGQCALMFYQKWIHYKTKVRIAPSSDTFKISRYFMTFINFTRFAKKISLPFPDRFIWFMVKNDFPPTMWMSDEIYGRYLNFLDVKITPLEQATNSVKSLLKWSDKHEIDPCEFFDTITANELIYMVRVRQLSPWLLLLSKKFSNAYSKFNTEQQMIMESLIQPKTWAQKVRDHLSDIEEIKKYIKELGI